MSLPRLLVALTSALALTMAGALLGAPVAAAATPPGYTIVVPQLTPLVVDGSPTRVLTGVLDGASYAVEVPPHWNGRLVLWAHGFRGNGADLTVDAPAYGLRQRFVDQGYAWAASSYDRNGYDVASGVTSTHQLARKFARLVGTPTRTYITGVSMGGQVIGRSLEQFPGFYSAAMPMCGVLGDHDLFDYFLDFTVSAQALAGVRAYPPGPNYATAVLPKIYAGLGLTVGDPTVATPAAKQLRSETVLDSGGTRPGSDAAFAYWKDFLFDLAVPGTGPTPVTGVAENPSAVATNVGHDYAPDSPVDLDAKVQRVPAADKAARNSHALTAVAPINGRPGVPVLTLHGIGDLFVPFSMEQIYAGEVAAYGGSNLLVQRAIRTADHCEFSDAEAGSAWDALVAWSDGGPRPAGDPVTNTKAVAASTFGCRFSDPAAYAAAGPPAAGDTRRLFAPCPAS